MTFIVLIIVAVAAAGYLYVVGLGTFSEHRERGDKGRALPPASGETIIDQMIGPMVAERPGQTGLCLLADNLAAFNARLETIEKAGRSLDLQYYYWKADITGQILCRALIAAADRGVRVRLLLDDINTMGFDSSYLALDSHPLIEVRLFNPSRSRTSPIRRGLELALKYLTSTRRMHNKCWIADNRIAIIGGRNIGDPYFNASNAANFQDIDLLATGAAVADAEAIFDRYWNSDAALPIRSLHRIRKPQLARLIGRLDDAARSEQARTYLDTSAALAEDENLETWLRNTNWVADATVAADPPEKAKGLHLDQWLVHRIEALLRGARSSIQITSPYFIPGSTGTELFEQMRVNGVSVEILTNSLAATDVIAVHGAYSRYRKVLVASGVSIHELKPNPSQSRASVFGSRTASLHTKSMVIDGNTGFVGSFNLDPRSASINTEMGIVFTDAGLASQLAEVFQRFISPPCSYDLLMEKNQLVWSTVEQDADVRFHSEPLASRSRAILAWLIRLLPIESQL